MLLGHFFVVIFLYSVCSTIAQHNIAELMSEELSEISSKCPSHTFRCNTGKCIPGNQICNGRAECREGEDETNCRCHIATQLQCLDGTCKDRTENCNGKFDCSQGEDELQCACRGGFNCYNDGRCIALVKKCDGNNDCYFGEDERHCHHIEEEASRVMYENVKTCPPNLFRCESGECISLSKRCDGVPDCVGHDDENGCYNKYQQKYQDAKKRSWRMESSIQDGKGYQRNSQGDRRNTWKESALRDGKERDVARMLYAMLTGRSFE